MSASEDKSRIPISGGLDALVSSSPGLTSLPAPSPGTKDDAVAEVGPSGRATSSTLSKEDDPHSIAIYHLRSSGSEDRDGDTSIMSHHVSLPDKDGKEGRSDERMLSSSPSFTKRKNLAAIFSTRVPTASSSSGERIPPGQGQLQQHSRSQSTNESVSENENAALEIERRAPSSPSISQTISQGVKSLQERHRSNREASETFKSFRSADRSEPNQQHQRAKSQERGHSSSQLQSEPTSQPPVTFKAAEVPDLMLKGEPMLKVTPKKVKQRIFRLDSDRGQILWESKKNTKVNLESIREVRTGSAATSYRTSMSIAASHEPRWISIIYQTGGVYKSLHIIALTDESFERWKYTLSAVQDERKMLMSGAGLLDHRQQLWLRQHWKIAETSQDSRLDFAEVTKLCQRLGILSNSRDLMRRFQEADKGKRYLNFEDFQHFVTLLKRRLDIEALFLHWADISVDEDALHTKDILGEIGLEQARSRLFEASSKARMSSNRFRVFLEREQGFRYLSSSTAQQIYKRYCKDGGNESQLLCYSGFHSFLMSSDNSLLRDQSSLGEAPNREDARTADQLIALTKDKVTHDMDRPLSEYYISSSHNTYLVGGQWKGDSTVEGYIRALLQGARSVEIDCWDGAGNEPQVTHGRTLTSKVAFRDVIVAVERYAFVASPFPLILSLEVHNDVPQQEALATILHEVLGEKLLSAHLPGQLAGGDELPSPQALRGKILVKAKNLLMADGQPGLGRTSYDDGAGGVPYLVAEKRTQSTTDTTESESDSLLNSARSLVRSVTKRRKGDREEKPRKVLMSPKLASLLIYTVGVKHRGINKKESYAVEHMISLSERSGLKYLKSEGNYDDLIKHNRTHMTRVYPSMSSFKRLSQSANFLPILFWSMGCQLVAINWQTLDIGFEMNQAMFARNGKCGYVLKPEALRFKAATATHSSKTSNIAVGAQGQGEEVEIEVSIRIISAQQLPRYRDASRDKEMLDFDDILDPFVSLCVIVPQHRDYNVRVVKSSRRKKGSDGIQSLLEDLTLTNHPSSSLKGDEGRPAPESISSTVKVNATSSLASSTQTTANSSAKRKNAWTSRQRTSVVKSNGFNPVWNETLNFSLRFHVSSGLGSQAEERKKVSVREHTRGLLDLCFVRFEVGEDVTLSGLSTDADSASDHHSNSRQNSLNRSPEIGDDDQDEEATIHDHEEDDHSTVTRGSIDSLGDDANCLATHMVSLGSLEQGYRHVPLYDAQLSQYLFSTLFVKTEMRMVV